MTEINYEGHNHRIHHVDRKGIVKTVLIYSLLLLILSILLKANILTDSLAMFSNVIQPVINSIINYCPIEVEIPTIPMGPGWNGSDGNASPYIDIPELLNKINR
ncbi:nuclease [Yersinia alsatica]|uniref:E492 group microcin n=1 Tax=Yersinia alsatica TaxID=2890317 RepID=UPI0032EAE4B6